MYFRDFILFVVVFHDTSGIVSPYHDTYRITRQQVILSYNVHSPPLLKDLGVKPKYCVSYSARFWEDWLDIISSVSMVTDSAVVQLLTDIVTLQRDWTLTNSHIIYSCTSTKQHHILI